MKTIFLICTAATLLSGCALTHEQVVARAKAKSNTELCMASIQFPQYGDAIAAELAERGHTCNWEQAAAQVQASAAADARRAAAIQAAAASLSAQPAYQVVQPVRLGQPAPLQAPALQPATATATWTGRQQQVQTVTYQSGWNCEYRYLANTFWRTFVGTCPSSVQVQ